MRSLFTITILFILSLRCFVYSQEDKNLSYKEDLASNPSGQNNEFYTVRNKTLKDGFNYTFKINTKSRDTLFFCKKNIETNRYEGRYISEIGLEGCQIKGMYNNGLKTGLWTYNKCNNYKTPLSLWHYDLISPETKTTVIEYKGFKNVTITNYDSSKKIVSSGKGILNNNWKIIPHNKWCNNTGLDSINYNYGYPLIYSNTNLSLSGNDEFKSGLIDRSGNTIVPFEYSRIIWKKNSGLYIIAKNEINESSNDIGLLDSLGKELIKPNYQIIGYGQKSVFLFSRKEKKWLIITNENGNYNIHKLKKGSNYERHEYGLIIWCKDKKKGTLTCVYNRDGQKLLDWSSDEGFDEFSTEYSLGYKVDFSISN